MLNKTVNQALPVQARVSGMFGKIFETSHDLSPHDQFRPYPYP